MDGFNLVFLILGAIILAMIIMWFVAFIPVVGYIVMVAMFLVVALMLIERFTNTKIFCK